MSGKEKELNLVQIPKIKIKETQIVIEGDSPLLIRKFSEKAKAEILNKQMKKAKEKTPKIPFQEFMESLHWITPMPDITGKTEEEMEEIFNEAVKNGAKFGFPTTAIKQAAISAAYRAGLSKNKVSLQGAFHILGDLTEIVGNLRMKESSVKIPSTGSADIVFRGEFEPGWKTTITVRYDENVISLEQIVQMINYGGFSVGIGEWRIEKGGNHGMFHCL